MKFARLLAFFALLSPAASFAQITPSPNRPSPPATQPPAQPAPKTQAPATAPAPAPPAPAEKIDPAKEAAIRHLMDITDTSKMGDNVLSYFSGRVRTILTQALGPDRIGPFMDSFDKKFSTAVPPSSISDAMVPVYARNFSMEDIQALIQFYESPLGQRVVKTMPQVEDDSQSAALQMGNRATIDVLQSMSTQYPELKQLLQDSDPGTGATPAPPAQTAPQNSPRPKTP